MKKIEDKKIIENKISLSFREYANKKFNGNFSAAADSIGQNRNKIRAIFDRVREAETGTRKGGIGIGTGGEKMTMTTLDSLELPGLDFIKIDVDGLEHLILKGGDKTLDNEKLKEGLQKGVDMLSNIMKK